MSSEQMIPGNLGYPEILDLLYQLIGASVGSIQRRALSLLEEAENQFCRKDREQFRTWAISRSLEWDIVLDPPSAWDEVSGGPCPDCKGKEGRRSCGRCRGLGTLLAPWIDEDPRLAHLLRKAESEKQGKERSKPASKSRRKS